MAISFDYGLNSAATEYDGENKYLRITDIDDDSREFNISDLTSPEINLFGLDEYRLSIGDILFARTGASVGKSYIYRSVDGKVYFAGFLIRVKIKDTFNPDFVFQNTLTSNYERFISITSMRSGQPGVNAQEYSNYEIMFPSLPEQSAIGTFFSTLDRHITLHQRKLDKLKSVKQAYLSEMFPAEGERVPKRRFPGFTDDWELRKLGEVVEVCSGRDYKHLGVGSIPVYGTGGYMLSVSEALSKNNDAIGIGRKGTIDSPYILRAPFWTVDTLFYCIPNDGFTLEFAYSIFQNINWKSMDESTGVPSLSKNGINNVKVLTPKIKEQSAIGTFFSTLDRHITLHQRKLEKLKNLKKALLNELFV